jgi:CPA1 family monovalent cation:H+ antiporter
VTTGLYTSWNGLRLIGAATRLQGIFFWDFLIYMIESLVFLITRLEARELIVRISQYSLAQLLIPAVTVSVVVIAARFVWMYPATYLPRWLFPSVRRKDPAPPWQWPFVLAFTGVRGIVSLAAALAIPIVMENGEPFPERDLILFLTFCVILVTLVGQGLLLPSVIRWLGLAPAGRREYAADRADERRARQQAIEAVIDRLDQLAAERHLPEDVVRPLRILQRDRLKHVLRGDGEEQHGKHSELHGEVELLLIATERDEINELYRSGKLRDEAQRRVERELDLREAQLANERAEDDP